MKHYTFIILCSIFLCFSCKEKNKISNTPTLSISLENPREPIFKDIFSSIEIIPLESNEKSIIGKLFKGKNVIYIPEKYYLTADNRYVINVFDIKGKFISNSINQIGEGPNNYKILQDFTFNPYTNTIDILDVFGNIFQYDIHFNFKSKYRITNNKKTIFRHLFPISINEYALFNRTDKNLFYIYNKKNEKIIKKVEYTGFIAYISGNFCPFNQENDELFFSPTEMNNNLYTYSIKTNKLQLEYTIDENDKCLQKADIISFKEDSKAISSYIQTECNKYISMKRLFNRNFLVSNYLKNNKIFNNIYNLKTHQNKTFSKSPDQTENLPTFFDIKENCLYSILFPIDLPNFININLLKNKDILNNIEEEDNPCIVRYYLK